MKPDPTPDQVRATLARLIEADGASFAALSRMIRRNHTYLWQFIHRGLPERLAEPDRLLLEQYFRIDERELGARDPWLP